ncbi:ARL14 effector protein-like [Tropilaelaps mercedesae]|uniref:ARL14 effector protein-like n=1 Tax=Tropilaelaps mercedesae TaxID=418985 RepID=A0A1V9X802_9ACAR|nr:ARL14 effector protein-like [Tropilaelaps mercedesae]
MMTSGGEKKEEVSNGAVKSSTAQDYSAASASGLSKSDIETQKRLTRLLTKLHVNSNAMGGPLPEPYTQRRTARRKGSEDTTGSSQSSSSGTAGTTTSTKPDKGKMHDGRGIHTKSGVDLCDCLNVRCPGCFFPCRRCGSTKCGPDCRSNRNFLYESWETNGVPDSIVTNPLLNV